MQNLASKRARRLFLTNATRGIGVCLLFASGALADVPALLNVQGRVLVRGAAFEGTGQFKIALVNADGSQAYWRNSSDANSDGQPDQSVSVTVSRGLYALALGDTALGNMAALPADVFANSGVYLRVWFNDGVNGFQRLAPDHRVTASGYSMMAANVSDGAVTSAKLAPELSGQIAALDAQVQSLLQQVAILNESAGSGLTVVSELSEDAELTAKGFESFMSVAPAAWSADTSAGAPSPRSGHSAVWTGEEMLVWGGRLGSGLESDAGAIYSPNLGQWRMMSTLEAPVPRAGHTAVWSGREMIVWGGTSSGSYPAAGGRFDPFTHSWQTISTTGGPDEGRKSHVAAWTGSRMIIWGGFNHSGLHSNGYIYNPVSDSWTELNLPNAPSARQGASGVWTGDRLLVWGGEGPSGSLNSGAELAFDANGNPSEWSETPGSRAPSARVGHSAIWTGERMIVWGGRSGGAFIEDGAAYDPESGEWRPLVSVSAPTPRANHDAVWTGQEMVVLGGDSATGSLASGGAYNPITDTWRALANSGTPIARTGATGVWSGTEILLFGGTGADGLPVTRLERLNPQPAWYFYRKL